MRLPFRKNRGQADPAQDGLSIDALPGADLGDTTEYAADAVVPGFGAPGGGPLGGGAPGGGALGAGSAGRRGRNRPGGPKLKRRRMSVRDVFATALLGPRTRLVRTGLSALGIAIGIAALVALQGIPATVRAEMKAEMDRQGANLLVVYPGGADPWDMSAEKTPLPETAPEMIARISPVQHVLARRDLVDVGVYRNNFIPAGQSGSISAAMADGDLLGALNVELADGAWFDAASRALPTVVLGDGAARRLGVTPGERIWIDRHWWAVIGVLNRLDLAPEMDSTAFLAPEYAGAMYPETPIASIYVASEPGQSAAVRRVIPETTNPADPEGVDVTSLSEYYEAGEMLDTMLIYLSLGLGGLSLLIGGIGIANTMVVAVMERRGEVGLRRAMGARSGQIALQFVLEAGVIGLIGGIFGVGIGAYATYIYAALSSSVFAVPWWIVGAGPVLSIVIGAIAGLYPSLKAARLSPTVALRAV
ncbi:MAG: ABC transporter permease [Bifidobacteriaceae bacterium]|jgi:putative ABC transport system permease protein|nr:ABC transporter permease [Bifidobacteriaceae bacterium]